MADIKIETKISVLIEKINYLFHSIQMNGGSINKIDKDLLLNYVRELYELTLSLPVDHPQQNVMQQIPPQYQQPQYQQPQQQMPPPQILQQPIQQQPQYFPPQQQVPPPQQTIPQQQNYQQPPSATNPSEEILHPAGPSIQQSFSGKQQQQKTVADIYSTQSTRQTVSEKIAKPQKELADKLRKSPIKDLKVFIGLNKRFSYINFLFNNDSRLYDEAIEKINGAPNYDEAMDYIENTLKQRLHWNQQDEMVMEFYNIVERRFLV